VQQRQRHGRNTASGTSSRSSTAAAAAAAASSTSSATVTASTAATTTASTQAPQPAAATTVKSPIRKRKSPPKKSRPPPKEASCPIALAPAAAVQASAASEAAAQPAAAAVRSRPSGSLADPNSTTVLKARILPGGREMNVRQPNDTAAFDIGIRTKAAVSSSDGHGMLIGSKSDAPIHKLLHKVDKLKAELRLSLTVTRVQQFVAAGKDAAVNGTVR
jgi:hypothetical protein